TSNQGASEMIGAFSGRIRDGQLPSYEEVREFLLDQIRRYFTERVGRPEILSRISDERIIVFDLLRPQVVRSICAKFLSALSASGREHQVTMSFDDSIADHAAEIMLLPQNLMMGGRRIKTFVKNMVEKPLADWWFRRRPPPGGVVRVGFSPDRRQLIV